MTLIGHIMYADYLVQVRSSGKRHFTSQEIKKDLGVSDDAVKAGLYRLKRDGKLISPLKGLYVIIPPEYKTYGCIPADELIPIMMNHLDAEYYVALLSAAGFYGAAHQKPMVFQVITNKRVKHSLTFGDVHIKLIYKKSLANLPIKNVVVSTGYLKVATPELIALDLLKYPKHAGGINNIATVLSELVESIDAYQLIQLAEMIGEPFQLQRLGFILEKIEVMDEKKREAVIDSLVDYVEANLLSYIPLVAAITIKGHPRCQKWKIIENTDFESD